MGAAGRGVDDEADKNDLDIGSGLPAAGDECTKADEVSWERHARRVVTWGFVLQFLKASPSRQGEPIMAITVEAVYENGTLKLDKPLPLKEHAQVQVTVRPSSVADQTYGMIGWSGDADTFDRLLQESDMDRLEHA